MEDGNKGVAEDRGQKDEGCWMWDMEHGIDAKASWSLKGNQKQRNI